MQSNARLKDKTQIQSEKKALTHKFWGDDCYWISADWKDKVKFSLGVPGTPISLNIVPRDIADSVVDKVLSGYEFR